jgi:hypothetical protein
MAQSCPLCGAAVSDEQSRCSSCGAELDPYGTIGIPKPKVRPPSPAPAPKPAKPHRPVVEEPAATPETREEPAPKPAPAPAKPARPRPRPSPAAASPAPPAAAPVPPPQPAPAQPAYPVPEAAAGAAPGGIRKWMIKMLGGQAEPGQPAPVPSAPPPAYPQPGSSQSVSPWAPAGASQPGSSQSAPPWAPGGSWPSAPGYPPPPGASYPAMPPVQPVMPPMAPLPAFGPAQAEDDEGKTQYMPGADIGKLKFPSSIYTLQLLDNTGQWRSWAPIGANGLNLGRSQGSAHFPFLSSMATRHARFSYNGPQLRVEDLGSLNGVYLKITAPVELQDGMRFRVGSQVIEFRKPEPFEPVSPLQGPDGEEFLSADLSCLAVLILIRPDNQPGLCFPITKPETTRIGREGKLVDIALPRAEWVSSQHAQIRQADGRFYLEDLNSRNGTFIQIREPTPIRSGDVLLVGRAFLRVVDQSGM